MRDYVNQQGEQEMRSKSEGGGAGWRRKGERAGVRRRTGRDGSITVLYVHGRAGFMHLPISGPFAFAFILDPSHGGGDDIVLAGRAEAVAA